MLAGPCRFQGSRNSQIAVSSVVDMRLRVKELVEGRPFLWRSLSLGWGPTAEMVDLDASENRNSAVARVGDDRWGKAMVERCIQHRANVTVPRANVRRDRDYGPNDRDPRDCEAE